MTDILQTTSQILITDIKKTTSQIFITDNVLLRNTNISISQSD